MGWRDTVKKNHKNTEGGRVKVLALLFIIMAGAIILRLVDLQIIKGPFYTALAAGQHELYQKLVPTRGSIYIKEIEGGQSKLYPLVGNQNLQMLYAVPTAIKNPADVAQKLFEILGFEEKDNWEKAQKDLFKDLSPALDPKLAEEIKQKRKEQWFIEKNAAELAFLNDHLSKPNSQYQVIRHRLTDDQVQKIQSLNIPGLEFQTEAWRYYPESNLGGQIFGFWGVKNNEREGMYGLEGYYNNLLAGKYGEIRSEKDTWGNIIAIGQNSIKEKEDGANLVLTIDRAIQYKACADLSKAVEHFKAEKGSIIVMDPKTGAILAMCGSPDYNPDQYSQVAGGGVYNIPAINEAYEPGSIFKTITMSAAIDTNKVTPETTYVDTGGVKFGPYTIKNYNNMVYGKQTMTEVLNFSINTGAMFAMEQTTPKVFLKYVENFGFGTTTHIELDREVPGDISNLYRKGDIYPATASFGQGIMVTPLQVASAYAAVANGGVLMKPYIVSQIIKGDGTVENTKAQPVRQVISSKTALTIMGMLVSVVDNGHGKNAAVPGYTVGGKTGTAQKAGAGGQYTSDVDVTFVGFAPFNDPKVVIAVAIRRPAGAPDAVTVTAPVFGSVAKFVMEYYNIPHDKDIPANFKPLPAWRFLSE